MVPLAEHGKVVAVLNVPRKGQRVYFTYTQVHNDMEFFQNLISSRPKRAEMTLMDNTAGKLVCTTKTISMFYPDNESDPDGPGHWESHHVTECKSQQLESCVGEVLPDGTCLGGGGNDPGYPYPGGGGEDPQPEPEDPCQKTKSVLNKPHVQQGINNVKAQALQSLSNINAGETGFKEKKDGTIAPADVNSNHNVVFNDVTDSYGGYHNHTALGTHMFAPRDIAETLFGFAAAQTNVADAYFGMIAAEWCSSCPNNVQYINYMIQFTGDASDLGINGNYNFTPAQIKQFENQYLIKVKELSNISLNGTTYIKNQAGDLNEKGLEKLFFEILKQMNLAGKVNLQRIESNGSISNVTLDNNGVPVGSPCP